MMNDRIIQLLARKLSGESTATERAELERLLVIEPEAIFYVELISRLWDNERVKEMTSRRVTDTDIAYLKHIARHGHGFGRPQPFMGTVQGGRIHRRFLRIAALFFLPLLAGSLYYFIHRHKAMAPDGLASGVSNSSFYALPGTRRTMQLPDGTKVWLNAGSRLIYDSNMLRKSIREVSLSGEAYFDVAKDKDRCFVIHTDKIAIRVLGTAFNVRAYPLDKITETTLMQGSIELTVNNKPYQKIILKPKEKFALIDDPRDELLPPDHPQPRLSRPAIKEKLVVQEITPVELADKEYVREVSWVENEFVFDQETMGELAPKMERWFNISLEIENRQIRDFHFTGIFHKETIDQALQAMQLIKPFKFKIINNHVLIN